MHASRSKVAFGMKCEVQMVALVDKERHDSGGSTGCIVVGELSEWKEFVPIVLLVVAVDSDVCIVLESD